MVPRNNYNTCGNLHDTKRKEAVTIEEVIDGIGFGWPQIKLGLIASLVWLSDGMEVMVLAILGPTLEYEWNITPAQQALLSTLVFVGFAIGSPIFGYISDRYGRWTSLVFSSLWTFFYGVLNAAVPNFWWLAILRLLLGVGIAGGMQSVAYYTEFLPGHVRAKAALCYTASWTLGSLLNVAVAMWMIQYSWRYWLLLSAAPGLIFSLFSPLIPESPRFELACGRREEALKILKSLAGDNMHALPDADIVQADVKSRGRISDLFNQQNRKTSILVGIAFFCNGFLYYGISLFSTYLIQAGNTCTAIKMEEEARQCSLQSHLLTTSNFIELLWTTSSEFPALLIALFAIDSLGRKYTALVKSLIVGICIASLYICISGYLLVFVLFVARGLMGLLPRIMFVYVSEVFPTEVRSIATGYASGMTRLGGIITPFFSQVLFNYSVKLGLTAYVCIAFLDALVYFLLPIETKGRDMGSLG